jgi:hypothetical protein
MCSPTPRPTKNRTSGGGHRDGHGAYRARHRGLLHRPTRPVDQRREERHGLGTPAEVLTVRYQEPWTRKAAQGLLLLLVIAIGARVVSRLLVPLLPVVVAGIVLVGVYALMFGRRR